jgi:hypothetical protein
MSTFFLLSFFFSFSQLAMGFRACPGIVICWTHPLSFHPQTSLGDLTFKPSGPGLPGNPFLPG